MLKLSKILYIISTIFCTNFVDSNNYNTQLQIFMPIIDNFMFYFNYQENFMPVLFLQNVHKIIRFIIGNKNFLKRLFMNEIYNFINML